MKSGQRGQGKIRIMASRHYKAAILTVSDSACSGAREDSTGPLIAALVEQMEGFSVQCTQTVPDEADRIAALLVEWADERDIDLVITTGGTGLSPRDVTPDATAGVIHREIPGMAEAMRLKGLASTPRAMLSRAVAGVRGKTLIINLPGSPSGVREGMDVVIPVLRHALDKINGDKTPCHKSSRG